MSNKKKIAVALITAIGASSLIGGLAACGGGEETFKPYVNHTYYVSATGSSERDDNGKLVAKGTKDDPYDISALLHYDEFYQPIIDEESGEFIENIPQYNDLEPGDVILVEPGEYNLDKRIRICSNGEFNKYITIKNADPSKECVLKFYDMTFNGNNRGVQLDGDYIRWEDIDVCGAGDNGLYIGGDYNIVQDCKFYDNRDTGLQLGRSSGAYTSIDNWPSYNLIKNCTSFNNYDNETYGENADGFAAKLTVGYANIFDGCVAYRNSDDGWDLYAKLDSGNIGAVIIYNCVAFENGFLLEDQETCNAKYPTFPEVLEEDNQHSFLTRDGDGNGFKLGGSIMEGEVFLKNCLSFNNRMHGVTDNSNPGVISIDGVTSYNNSAYVNLKYGSPEYGHITYAPGVASEDSANIDMSRQTYSYNHIANVLSVNDNAKALAADAYRGTVTNSILYGEKDGQQYWNKVGATEECDTKNSNHSNFGERTTMKAANEIFKELPTKNLGLNKEIHKLWRNKDGSLNLGDLFAIKDETISQGSALNKSSWNDYTHFPYTDVRKLANRTQSIAAAVLDSTYLPINQSAVYQNFYIVNKIMGWNIKWTSSNEDVIKLTPADKVSPSASSQLLATVNRPSKDTTVTLTATYTNGDYSQSKSYTVTVLSNTFMIGNIMVDGVVEDEIIVDKDNYDYYPATPVVLNATSDAGVKIDPSLYAVETSYLHSVGGGQPTALPDFDVSRSGIFDVTVKITLKNSVPLGKFDNISREGSYTYRIYVADPDADVKFSGEAAMNVYRDGYILSGDLSSPTGFIYTKVVNSGSAAPTADSMLTDGVKREFRATSTTQRYEADNSHGYDIYYMFTNLNGKVTCQPTKVSVTTQNITNKADFEAMLQNNTPNKIYMLTSDIDFAGAPINVSAANGKPLPFRGLFNGMGHTLSNINITRSGKKSDIKAAGLFESLQGGTIMNVKFNEVDITISGDIERVGIIGEMYGGYVYNVAITNINVTSAGARSGGLIGQSTSDSEKGAYNSIERVSLVNDADHKLSGSARVGGIIGYAQAGQATYYQELILKNCFVSTKIENTSDYSGGIIGRSDSRHAKDYVEIDNCVFAGVIDGPKYTAGILGGFSAAGKYRVSNCIHVGTLYYAHEKDEVMTPLKNCSGIMGYFAGTADAVVNNCYSRLAEYNSDYNVEQIGWKEWEKASFWNSDLIKAIMDYENMWQVNPADGEGKVAPPYVTLKFAPVSAN